MEKRNAWGRVKESLFKGSKEQIERDLETIDFDLLRTIFEEIYKKSGLDVQDMDFVKKEFHSRSINKFLRILDLTRFYGSSRL